MTDLLDAGLNEIVENSPEHNRVYWHSRRGMLELDVLLMPFAKKCLPTLNATDQARYVKLLEEEDQDLFLWLMQRSVSDDSELQYSVEQILKYAHTRAKI